MGLISALTGLGSTLKGAKDIAEIFVGNRTDLNAEEHAEFIAALEQLSAEFAQPPSSWFDRLINGLNRMPRPALALGTLGLFVFAMADPVGFAGRMQGLQLVPDPLWWLLGAIVSFYFGARELHYLRDSGTGIPLSKVIKVRELRRTIEALEPLAAPDSSEAKTELQDPNFNAALEEWRVLQS